MNRPIYLGRCAGLAAFRAKTQCIHKEQSYLSSWSWVSRPVDSRCMRRRNPVEVQALPYGCLDLEGRICGTKVLNSYLVRQEGKLGAPGLAKRRCSVCRTK